MPRILRCKDLREAVECLKDEGNDCPGIAAYLYAAGVPKGRAQRLLVDAGFTGDQAHAATAAPYASVKTSIVDRLRTLRALHEAVDDGSYEPSPDA